MQSEIVTKFDEMPRDFEGRVKVPKRRDRPGILIVFEIEVEHYLIRGEVVWNPRNPGFCEC
jgi:hypothetical protein